MANNPAPTGNILPWKQSATPRFRDTEAPSDHPPRGIDTVPMPNAAFDAYEEKERHEAHNAHGLCI